MEVDKERGDDDEEAEEERREREGDDTEEREEGKREMAVGGGGTLTHTWITPFSPIGVLAGLPCRLVLVLTCSLPLTPPPLLPPPPPLAGGIALPGANETPNTPATAAAVARPLAVFTLRALGFRSDADPLTSADVLVAAMEFGVVEVSSGRIALKGTRLKHRTSTQARSIMSANGKKLRTSYQ
jgi:hypothetical protein